MSRLANVLYCQCAHSDVIPEDTKREVFRRLAASGVAFEATPDLCELAARRDPKLKQLAQAGKLRIAACHPRAVKWLFAAAAAPLEEGQAEFFNMRNEPPDQIAAWLDGLEAAESARQPRRKPPRAGKAEWIPWFPVIDRDRCQNCKQCLNFCLFGVYAEAPDGRVEVAEPKNCKTNCPACARLCPEAAIIFPKYKSGPIAGDDPDAADAEGEKVRVDISALLAGDVHEALRSRSRRARPSGEEAGLAQQLEIPPEALAELKERMRKGQDPPAAPGDGGNDAQ